MLLLAGSKRVASPAATDLELLVNAINDTVLPRLTASDAHQFEQLMQDIFADAASLIKPAPEVS